MPPSRVFTVRAPEAALPGWREAAVDERSFNAWIVRSLEEAAAAELAARSEAGRLAAERARLRGRVFPAKPQERR